MKEHKSVLVRVWSKEKVIQRDGVREFLGGMALSCIQIVVVVTLEFIEMHTKRFNFIKC